MISSKDRNPIWASAVVLGVRIPGSLSARIRLMALVLAAGLAVAMIPALLGADASLPWRAAATAAAGGLAAYWIRGYSRARFSVVMEPVEALALFVIMHVAPGNPFLPLVGLVFRSSYGGFSMATIRYLLWVAALLSAHEPRGSVQLHGDISRALGTALAIPLMQVLRVALARLESSERRLGSLIANSTDIVTVVDAQFMISWQADSITAVLGYDPAEVLRRSFFELVHPDDREALRHCLRRACEHASVPRTLELRVCHRDGRRLEFEVVVANRLHDPSVAGLVLNLRDTSDRHQLEGQLHSLTAQLAHDATHDSLTGLANRRRLEERMQTTVGDMTRTGGQLALMMIDLDGFKELNDTLGHVAGDQLLSEIGPRLTAHVPAGGLVARFGGDEFAVMVPLGDTPAQATLVARGLWEAIEQPFLIHDLKLRVGASIGIATFPEHGTDPTTLIQRADIAMYQAKRNHSGFAHYDPANDGHSRERLALIGELPGAIADGHLILHYQPKYQLGAERRLTGVEALVRWNHPTRGMIGPDQFITLAEQSGLMRPLTNAVLEIALHQCCRWRARGIELQVAVNLSAQDLLDTALPNTVQALLHRYAVPPKALQFEVTETMVAADPDRVLDTLQHLRELGLSLSLDDFGTGSSSLSFLRHLPVQQLKIDRSFISTIDADPQDAAIVRSIIRLAHDLQMTIVAEGIETQAAAKQLASYGCDEGQGYLLGRPMPAEAINVLLSISHAADPSPDVRLAS